MFAAAICFIAGPAAADPPPTETGLFAGTFVSNYFHQFFDDTKWTNETRPNISKVSPLFGARYAVFPWSRFGVEAEATMAIAGVDGHDDLAKLYGLRLQAIVQYPVGPVTPFVALGGGVLHTSSNTLGADTDYPIHAGAGLRYWITPSLGVRFDARFIRGPSSQSPYTLAASYGEFAIGVAWVPGGAAPLAPVSPSDPDPDHDGILGDADHCPTEPGGGSPDGCPARDRDGDGILDRDDHCPDEAETVNSFQDSDGCPDTVPDTDHDGVDDLHDKCMTEPEDRDGFEDGDGCPDPDNDGDGVPDAEDTCPNGKGPVDNHGCPDPDRDQDGVVDRLDNCPDEAGNDHGCAAKQLAWIDGKKLVAPIKFLTGGGLGASARPVLDNVAAIIKAHDGWKLQVRGTKQHVDAVVKYLADKQITVTREDVSSPEVELHIE